MVDSNNLDPVRSIHVEFWVFVIRNAPVELWLFGNSRELESRHEWSESVAFWALQVTGAIRLESVGELAGDSLGVTDGGIEQ